jgi:Na+/H+ antiporter NhaD/arsenite permease-like protein
MPPHPAWGLPLLIFLGTYAVLAFGRVPLLRVDRTGAAIIGAILMIVAGGVPIDEAYRSIDYRTLVLLFGMMVLVANLRLALFFRVLAQGVTSRVTHPAWLLVAIVGLSGGLSALFVNDTICLVFTPVLIEVARARNQKPLPYLLALATASNIGSTAAITGNPQNMLIGSLSGLSFARFSAALGPVALAGLSIDAAVLYAVFRHDLRREMVAAEPPAIRPVHRAMMIKSLLVAAGVLAGFLAGFEPALVSACGAAVLLVTRRVKPEKVYRQIDWGLLVLFVGLFIVIHGVARAGLDARLFELLQPIGVSTVAGLSIVSAALSNLVSNVPAVMLFTRIVPTLPDPATAWLALAMSSTLAGNLTILGSVANLIVVEGAQRQGIRVSFGDYLRVGVPVTALTLLVGVAWLSR